MGEQEALAVMNALRNQREAAHNESAMLAGKLVTLVAENKSLKDAVSDLNKKLLALKDSFVADKEFKIG